jgi:hypothetical protein
MLSEQDMDRLTVIIAAAGLVIGFIFVWTALALVNGSVLTFVVAYFVLAIMLGLVIGKVIHRGGRS